MVILLVFTVTVLPVSISFFSETLDPAWLSVNTLTDFLFVMDIIINFRTGIVAVDGSPQFVRILPTSPNIYLKACLFWLPTGHFGSLFNSKEIFEGMVHCGCYFFYTV